MGGLETVARDAGGGVRRAWATRSGCITETPARNRRSDDGQFSFPVLRRPGRGQAAGARCAGATCIFKTTSACARSGRCCVVRRPWVRLAPDLGDARGRHAWAGRTRLKKFLVRLRLAHRHQPSRGRDAAGALRRSSATRIRTGTFHANWPAYRATRDLVFLGRLVSDKGVRPHCSTRSPNCKRGGLRPNVTIVGDGPEMGSLQADGAVTSASTGQVTFVGHAKRRNRSSQTLNRAPDHGRALAAAGTVRGGGAGGDRVRLRAWSVRSSGGTERGHRAVRVDVPQRRRALPWPKCLRTAAARSRRWTRGLRAGAEAHLEKHSPRRIAEAYLRVFEEARAMILMSYPHRATRSHGKTSLALADAGLLDRTLDVPALGARRNAVERWMPESIGTRTGPARRGRNRCARASTPRRCARPRTAAGGPGAGRAVAGPARGGLPCSVDAVFQELDRTVARRLPALLAGAAVIRGVYAYEDGAALELFRAARRQGSKCIYDLPIGYWAASERDSSRRKPSASRPWAVDAHRSVRQPRQARTQERSNSKPPTR